MTTPCTQDKAIDDLQKDRKEQLSLIHKIDTQLAVLTAEVASIKQVQKEQASEIVNRVGNGLTNAVKESIESAITKCTEKGFLKGKKEWSLTQIMTALCGVGVAILTLLGGMGEFFKHLGGAP